MFTDGARAVHSRATVTSLAGRARHQPALLRGAASTLGMRTAPQQLRTARPHALPPSRPGQTAPACDTAHGASGTEARGRMRCTTAPAARAVPTPAAPSAGGCAGTDLVVIAVGQVSQARSGRRPITRLWPPTPGSAGSSSGGQLLPAAVAHALACCPAARLSPACWRGAGAEPSSLPCTAAGLGAARGTPSVWIF